MSGHFPKRSFDLMFCIAAAFLVIPLALLVAAAIWISMGRPVLFLQRRTGRQGREFTMAKFRTMRCGLEPDAERLTRLGLWLRRTSLDELPQFWNVLRGEMSLVGPRPLLPAYLTRYSSRQRRRLLVPPGITGWAQINGRNAVDWATRFELDNWYVDHRTFWLDLKILAFTLMRVMRSTDISHGEHATMPEFQGEGAR